MEVAAGAPAADLVRLARVADVEDVEAVLLRSARELRIRERGVHPDVAARRREPDLVGAARLRANEREPARVRRAGDVVEREPAEEAGRALLDAGDREHAGEGGRVNAPDDRLLGPGVLERGHRAPVGEGRDPARAARVREVVDPDALGRAVGPALVAGEVGVVALADDVAAVAAARIRVADQLEASRRAFRAARRPGRDGSRGDQREPGCRDKTPRHVLYDDRAAPELAGRA